MAAPATSHPHHKAVAPSSPTSSPTPATTPAPTVPRQATRASQPTNTAAPTPSQTTENPTPQTAVAEPAWQTLNWSALQQQCALFYPAPTAQGCIWGHYATATAPSPNVPVMVIMDADYTMQLQQGAGEQAPALRLLQNMLTALGWQRDDVCISSWQRSNPARGLVTSPSIEDAIRYDHILHRQAQLLGCKALLLLDPQAQKRAAQHSNNAPNNPAGAVATTTTATTNTGTWLGLHTASAPHPSQLLRRPASKTQAWEALCLLAHALPSL